MRPAIAGNWKLHHENAPSYTCAKMTDYVIQNGIASILQLPYSRDLAPADLSLFPKVKSSLEGHHHGTLSAVKEVCTHTLKDLPELASQGAFESWKSSLQKCVDAQGMYFEEFKGFVAISEINLFFRNFSRYFLYRPCMWLWKCREPSSPPTQKHAVYFYLQAKVPKKKTLLVKYVSLDTHILFRLYYKII